MALWRALRFTFRLVDVSLSPLVGQGPLRNIVCSILELGVHQLLLLLIILYVIFWTWCWPTTIVDLTPTTVAANNIVCNNLDLVLANYYL